MATFNANGIDVFYQFDGPETAPVLLLSNSLGTRLEMWDDQISSLTPHFRVLRYDSRGHGRTSAPDGDYTMDQLGEDALTMLDNLNIEKVYYCGLSKGGMIGQWLGRKAPERLHRLVVSNTSPHMGPKEVWNERIKMTLENGMAALVEPVTARWFTPEFIASAPDRVARVQDMILSTPPQGYAGCSAAIRDMDQRDGLASITVPTLVIAGEKDPATPPEHGELIANSIPGAKLEIIPNAAHLSNIEQTEHYNKVLTGFLTS